MVFLFGIQFPIVLGENFINKLQDLFTEIDLHSGTLRRVVPNQVPFPLLKTIKPAIVDTKTSALKIISAAPMCLGCG